MENIIIVGCGGHAKSIIDLLESTDQWHIKGLIGLPSEVGKTIFNYKVIGTDADLANLARGKNVVLGIGHMPGDMKSSIALIYFQISIIISQ